MVTDLANCARLFQCQIKINLMAHNKTLLFCQFHCFALVFAPHFQYQTPADQQLTAVWMYGLYKIFILAACLLLHIKHSVVILITCRQTFIIHLISLPLLFTTFKTSNMQLKTECCWCHENVLLQDLKDHLYFMILWSQLYKLTHKKISVTFVTIIMLSKYFE